MIDGSIQCCCCHVTEVTRPRPSTTNVHGSLTRHRTTMHYTHSFACHPTNCNRASAALLMCTTATLRQSSVAAAQAVGGRSGKSSVTQAVIAGGTCAHTSKTYAPPRRRVPQLAGLRTRPCIWPVPGLNTLIQRVVFIFSVRYHPPPPTVVPVPRTRGTAARHLHAVVYDVRCVRLLQPPLRASLTVWRQPPPTVAAPLLSRPVRHRSVPSLPFCPRRRAPWRTHPRRRRPPSGS